MSDEDAGEIFALARDAFKGGQRQFQIQAFPFRMTPENIARHRGDPNMDFWMNLKVGYDHFEVTRQAPSVEVCNKTYVFDADAGGKTFNASAACPAYVVPEWIATAVAEKQASDDAKVAALSGKLERDASQLAAQEQKVADQVAAEQAAATEEAARKPLLGRVFGGKKGDPEPEPVTETATVTTEPPATTAAVEPAPAAAAKAPRPQAAAAAPATGAGARPDRGRPDHDRDHCRAGAGAQALERLRLAGGRGRRGRHQVPAVRARRPAADGELTKHASRSGDAVRYNDYKYRFTDQPNGWLGATLKVDWPILVNLRLDPFERTGMPSGATGSLAFYNWFAYQFWRFVFVQQVVGELAQTAIDFPPMQKGASFNLEAVKQQIDAAIAAQHAK